MTTSICQYCKNTVSKQNMRRHQKTETCKKFQVPVLSDFDKEVMRLCEEKERIYNSDYEYDSDDDSYDSDQSSESEWGWLGYDILDNDEMTQLKDVLRKKLQVVPEEEE